MTRLQSVSFSSCRALASPAAEQSASSSSVSLTITTCATFSGSAQHHLGSGSYEHILVRAILVGEVALMTSAGHVTWPSRRGLVHAERRGEDTVVSLVKKGTPTVVELQVQASPLFRERCSGQAAIGFPHVPIIFFAILAVELLWHCKG